MKNCSPLFNELTMPTGTRFALFALALLVTGANLAAPGPESPPLPPIPDSPIAQFRVWLSLTQSERDRALSEKPAAMRSVLLAKLAEYDAMEPVPREMRLRATELQYYFRPLLQLLPDERPERLAHVPERLRTLIVEQLRQWDALDADTRAALIQNGWAIRHFVRLENITDEEQSALRDALPPARRAQFESQLAGWKALPSEQRQQITRAFHRFFELPPAERQRTLENLPESERRDIQATLQAFAKLAPAQRQQCLDSFRKFAGFSSAERADFLRNADRWKEMSPEDRAAWRRLVTQLPPMPPSLSSSPQPMPPLPSGAQRP